MISNDKVAAQQRVLEIAGVGSKTDDVKHTPRTETYVEGLLPVLETFGFTRSDIRVLVERCGYDEAEINDVVANILEEKIHREQPSWVAVLSKKDKKAEIEKRKEDERVERVDQIRSLKKVEDNKRRDERREAKKRELETKRLEREIKEHRKPRNVRNHEITNDPAIIYAGKAKNGGDWDSWEGGDWTEPNGNSWNEEKKTRGKGRKQPTPVVTEWVASQKIEENRSSKEWEQAVKREQEQRKGGKEKGKGRRQQEKSAERPIPKKKKRKEAELWDTPDKYEEPSDLGQWTRDITLDVRSGLQEGTLGVLPPPKAPAPKLPVEAKNDSRETWAAPPEKLQPKNGVSSKFTPSSSSQAVPPENISSGAGPKREEKGGASGASHDSTERKSRDKDKDDKVTTVPDMRKMPDEHQGQMCEVKKHSSMGCAVITLKDSSIKAALLALATDGQISIGDVVVQMKPHKNKAGEEAISDIFVAWGRQIEKCTPVTVVELTEFFDNKAKLIQQNRRSEAAPKSAPSNVPVSASLPPPARPSGAPVPIPPSLPAESARSSLSATVTAKSFAAVKEFVPAAAGAGSAPFGQNAAQYSMAVMAQRHAQSIAQAHANEKGGRPFGNTYSPGQSWVGSQYSYGMPGSHPGNVHPQNPSWMGYPSGQQQQASAETLHAQNQNHNRIPPQQVSQTQMPYTSQGGYPYYYPQTPQQGFHR